MDTTGAKTKARTEEAGVHQPLSVELKVGQRVQTPEGTGRISGFPGREESIGFDRTRMFYRVEVALEGGGSPSFAAKDISVVKDA